MSVTCLTECHNCPRPNLKAGVLTGKPVGMTPQKDTSQALLNAGGRQPNILFLGPCTHPDKNPVGGTSPKCYIFFRR